MPDGHIDRLLLPAGDSGQLEFHVLDAVTKAEADVDRPFAVCITQPECGEVAMAFDYDDATAIRDWLSAQLKVDDDVVDPEVTRSRTCRVIEDLTDRACRAGFPNEVSLAQFVDWVRKLYPEYYATAGDNSGKVRT